ncbi:ATP-dependent DNA helicase Q4 [Anabrus simplex]|uniref:ATP-dependent DNA helicase Q4 n=1 Tax=Anabrus simplex TaxID=316456 RepID=UPI0035A3C13F
MDLFKDPNFRLKYRKSKYKVKVWESEFRKLNGHNPTKLDIKAAEPHVREAYKAYYKLKTRILEDLEIVLSDESENDILGDLPEAKKQLLPSDSSDKVLDQNDRVKPPRTVLGVINKTENSENSDDTVIKKPPLKKEECFVQDVASENGVWGSHLNRAKETIESQRSKVRSMQQRSLSASFTEKLLQGAKFSKRNPRKSLASRVSKSSKTRTSFFEENASRCDILSASLPAFSSSQSLPSEEESSSSVLDFSVGELIDTNFKVVHNSTPINSQAVSVIQQAVSSHGPKLMHNRTMDKGWLERCTKLNDFSNIHETFNNFKELPDQCSPQTAMQSRKEVNQEDAITAEINGDNTKDMAVVVESDEDVVYGSDTETDTKMKASDTSIRFATKRKFMPVKAPSSSAHESEMILAKKPRSFSMRTEDVTDSRPSLAFELPCTDVKETLTAMKPRPSVARGSEVTDNIPEIEVSPADIKELSDHIIAKENVVKKHGRMTKKLSEKELLQKKVASGQVNENFVRINLKKKVYARGKKNSNFSKYKKLQWKKKKKAGGYGDDTTYSGGTILKCFSCGEAGHFAQHCLKGDKLLPQDNEEEEDESPFPTLEEAALMAAESAVPSRRRPIVSQDNVDSDISATPGMSLPGYVVEALNKDEGSKRVVEPLYQLKPDGTLRATPKEVHDTLKLFGHSQFRPGQEVAVMRILSGLSTLVTLSTGSGKSLCYQLPAYLYSKKSGAITLVISPLVSLMEDQVTGVPSCIKAACIHMNQQPKEQEKVLEMAKTGKLSILLVSPEAVVSGERSKGFGSILKELPPIAFACIDEAHCVSMWSHNFRPSYLMICQVLRDRLGVKTVLGLTATATKVICASIVEHLSLPDGEEGVIKDIPMPKNLLLSVSKDRRRDDALITLLSGPRFKNLDSIIVYCTRREECERLAVLIRTCLQDFKKPQVKKTQRRISWNAEPYHAGLSAARRKSVQKAFMSGQLRIVVATVAFGMGINKSDIRGIIHYNMPRNFESYVQEVGRAGRDGLPAQCHLFLDCQGNDQNELRRHINANSVERHVIRKLLQRVFVPCKCSRTNENAEGIDGEVKCPGHEVAFSVEDTVQALDLPEENISTMLCYLELHPKKWIKVLPKAYTKCLIQSYKGPKALKAAAKMSPPLAMAIALDLQQGISHDNSHKIEFSVIDIAAALGWDSGLAKSRLKNLEWQKVNDKWRRTGLIVEFSCLGFRVQAPGNLQPAELDEALDSLHERVKYQEKTSHQNLQAVFNAFTSVAFSTCSDCLDDVDLDRSERLKVVIREYFQHETLDIEVETQPLESEEQVIADVRQLVCSYRDHTFTGRAVARIFHGIASPCFPALVWSRCRLWRSHLSEDFKLLSKIASREILQLR